MKLTENEIHETRARLMFDELTKGLDIFQICESYGIEREYSHPVLGNRKYTLTLKIEDIEDGD